MATIDDMLAYLRDETKTLSPQQQVLQQPFDIETHKATFTNYLEVVILEDGTIEYAVPSHQEKLKQIYRDRFQSDPDEDCPEEFYFDYLAWLEDSTRTVSVWSNTYHKPYNAKQRQVLLKLVEEGLTRCSTQTGTS